MEYNALYIQLMNRILDKMRRGEYQVGDKMDSERVMAQQYGINRQTVRKALKMLEEEGYKNIELIQDLSGRDRIGKARK